MIITASIDEQLAQRASLAAQQMGMTLNQALSDYLELLADGSRRSLQWDQFEARCLASTAKLEAWHFDRDTANSR
ncbi:MAG: MerR family transcriptional regulator [Rhodoferax sp.]|nr:MerR family transcriptional regulator [Rhodoferax sp.]